MLMFKLTATGHSDIGLKRDHNEDCFMILPEFNLFLVADGMGGHRAGDVASRLAVETIQTFFQHTESEDATWPFHFDPKMTYEENRVYAGIQMANRAIINHVEKKPERAGMGTTIVALHFSKSSPVAYIAHVGDSRCYVIRNGEINQLTRDHSLLNDFIEAIPEMSEGKKQTIPRNIITRALGMGKTLAVDINKIEVEKDDVFLLCSDGLTAMAGKNEILITFDKLKKNLKQACKELINLANSKGGEDNITVVLVKVDEIIQQKEEQEKE